MAQGDSPAAGAMVQSDVEIPRIEPQCFLELDSQKWRCTEFRGNFYKVIFFLSSLLLLPFSQLQAQRDAGDAARAAPGLWLNTFVIQFFSQSCQ